MKKSNCLCIFDPPSSNREQALSELDELFSRLRSSCWVYIADPRRHQVDDGPGGTRFVPWHDDLIQSFGELSTVVVIGNGKLFRKLRKELPSSVGVILMPPPDHLDQKGRAIADAVFSAFLQTMPKTARGHA
ncbi:MAG: hypothetical protein WD342_16785 [Verrucomicrobiales bacterium]